MRSIYTVAAALILGTLVNASAIAQSVDKPQSRMAICGSEWKAHKEANGKPAKGEGREAWNKFRVECFTRHPKPEPQKTKAAERAA
jgi:hypothetical protein